MTSYWILVFSTLLVMGLVFSAFQGVASEDEDGIKTFSEKEKEMIAKLRSAVEDKLTHDFMKTDEYLFRWIVAKRMNVKQAQVMLETALKWRKDNNIDNILNEDFPLFEKNYPVRTYGVDKLGHPIIGVHFGKWVVRKAAQNGQIDKLIRYMVKTMMEEPRVKAEELAKASGKPNTRIVMLIDLSGYNLREHACLQCFGLYTQFVQLYENYYPEATYKNMVVNAPTIFEAIMELIRPIMSPASKRDLIMSGVRKADWIPIVHKYIDKDQIPPQFGGSNKKYVG